MPNDIRHEILKALKKFLLNDSEKNVFLLPYCALLVWDEITDRPEPNSGDVSVWLFLILDAKEKYQWASLTYAFDEWSVWG